MSIFKKARFVKQYLFFYLLALIMPLLMGVIFYVITYNLEYQKVQKDNTTFLNHCMEKLNDTLIDSERLSIQLLTDDDIQRLIQIDDLFSSINIYKAAEFLKENNLIPRVLLNDLLVNYFIIDPDFNYVFSEDKAYPLESFYSYDYKIKEMDYSSFKSLLSNIKQSGFYPEYPIISVDDRGFIYYPYFHIYNRYDGKREIVIVLVNPSSISSLLKPNDSRISESLIHVEYNGKAIISEIETFFPTEGYIKNLHKMEKVGNNYISTASLQNWSCYLLQPADIIDTHIKYIPKLTLLMIVAILILGFMFMLFLAYRSSRPVITLLDKLHHDKEITGVDTDALTTLDFFIDQMKGRNHQLEKLIGEQKTKLKTNFLISLLYDIIPDPSQIPTLARHAGVVLGDNPFFTVVVQLQSQKTILEDEWEHLFPISLVSLQNKVFKLFGSKVHLIQINLNQICLFSTCSDLQQLWERDKLIEILVDWVKVELQETFIIGVSKPHFSWQEAPRSFKEARAALIYNWPNNDNSVNKFEDNSDFTADGDVYFPVEMIHVMLDAIRSGRTKDLKECLTRINRENLELRKLKPFAQNILIAHYQEIMSKIIIELEIENTSIKEDLNNLINTTPSMLSEYLSKIEITFLKLCEYFYSDQTRKELEIAESIKEYIEDNFKNNQLSLVMVADHHNLSNQFITRLIKKYYGKTFRNFMEDLRMEYVRKLILESDKPINTIIDSGGYNSMNTFCKAFKRKYGYSASSLRE